MNKKLIIFDCYGTLLTSPKTNPHAKFISNIGADPKTAREKLLTEKSVSWNEIIPSSFDFMELDKHLNILNLEIQLEMNNIFPYLDDISSRLDNLREHYKVVILSNLSSEYSKPIEKYLINHVDHCFYSFEIGKIKPRMDSFEHVIDWYKNKYEDISPMEVILVDDHSQNVNKVNFMGGKGFLVNNSSIESTMSIKGFFNWINSH